MENPAFPDVAGRRALSLGPYLTLRLSFMSHFCTANWQLSFLLAAFHLPIGTPLG